jgi:hypothetical protein
MYHNLAHRWSLSFSAVLCLLAAASELRAQTCPGDAALVVIFSPGTIVPASGTIDQVHFEAKSADTPINPVAGHTLPWTPTQQEVGELQRISDRAVVAYRSSQNPDIVCRRDFQVMSAAGPATSGENATTPIPGTAIGGGTNTDGNSNASTSIGGETSAGRIRPNPRVRIPLPNGDCDLAGRTLSAQIARERPGANFTAVIFDAATQAVCYQSTDRPTYGGWLNVAVLTNDPIVWNASRVSYSPCSLQSGTLSLYAPEKLPAGGALQAGDQYLLLRFQPRRCYDTTVNITVETVPRPNTNDVKVTMRHELPQAPRYHAALQVGVIFSNLHDHEFGLTRDGDSTRVFDKGPVGNGPEYTATLLIYSLLNQLRGLAGGERYGGRELVTDDSPLDRIGGVLGVGLNKPGERFSAGVAYEAIPGINASLVWDFARVRRLVGIRPGASFAGSEQQLPIQRQWHTSMAFGLSLDLTYAAKLLGR